MLFLKALQKKDPLLPNLDIGPLVMGKKLSRACL